MTHFGPDTNKLIAKLFGDTVEFDEIRRNPNMRRKTRVSGFVAEKTGTIAEKVGLIAEKDKF